MAINSTDIDDAELAILESVEDGAVTLSADGMTRTEHALRERLDAIDRIRRRTSATSGVSPIRFTKVISSGLQ